MEIEQKLGVSLTWDRADKAKSSIVSYRLYDVSLSNETDWPRMASSTPNGAQKSVMLSFPT